MRFVAIAEDPRESFLVASAETLDALADKVQEAAKAGEAGTGAVHVYLLQGKFEVKTTLIPHWLKEPLPVHFDDGAERAPFDGMTLPSPAAEDAG